MSRIQGSIFVSKSILVRISLLFGSILFLVIAGEVAVRMYYSLRAGIPFTEHPVMNYHPELGWEGIEVFGNAATDKYKIFVVGDSFTAETSKGKVYHEIMGTIL